MSPCLHIPLLWLEYLFVDDWMNVYIFLCFCGLVMLIYEFLLRLVLFLFLIKLPFLFVSLHRFLNLVYDNNPGNLTYTFNELRGSGTFKTSSSTGGGWPTVNHKVLDWSSFTGSLDIDRGRFVFVSLHRFLNLVYEKVYKVKQMLFLLVFLKYDNDIYLFNFFCLFF